MSFFAKSDSKPESSSKGTSTPPPVPAGETVVRTKPYTGLETKTLWNHFSKDDLMTVAEIGELLDRMLIKDAGDIYTPLKASKGWREYCSQAMRIMDTSGGSTVDLQEFSGQFNVFYKDRLYFMIKYLLPALQKELKRICRDSGMEKESLAEIEALLKGGETKVVVKEADRSADIEEISRLKNLLNLNEGEKEKLKGDLTRVEGVVGELKGTVDTLRGEKKLVEEQLGEKKLAEQEMMKQIEGLSSQLETMRGSVNRSSEGTAKALAEKDRECAKRVAEIESKSAQELAAVSRETEALRSQIAALIAERDSAVAQLGTSNAMLEANKVKLSSESVRVRDLESELKSVKSSASGDSARIADLVGENSKLKRTNTEHLTEWKSKIEAVLAENEEARSVLHQLRGELVKVNAEILEIHLSNSAREKEKVTSVHAAAMSGTALDPFRTEIVRRYGSLDALLGKRPKMTLLELERAASMLGYSREYSRRLFYALDTRNKGFLTIEQFGRPLPVLNKELCLLVKQSS